MSSAVKDINHLLHDLRSAHLRRMPRAEVMLSAGCAGTWYFEWIAKQTRHNWLIVDSCARDRLCRTMKSVPESLNIKEFIT